ncbi:hypothetical protein G6010_12685 [Dietzia sp. SLG510A3-3B2-2]|nr:hypothetical protein [Dietzia sp. SLG510A3-3B2-2]
MNNMSMPRIPGYLESKSTAESLAEFWERPEGDFPKELWPTHILRGITRNPQGWLTVAMHRVDETGSHGIRCVLVAGDGDEAALSTDTWIGRDLGSAGGEPGEYYYSGLREVDRGVELEFFVQIRQPTGANNSVADVSPSFLWYWDAFPVDDGWRYVDESGREHDLLRYELHERDWTLQVRASELRMFLASSGRAALMQVDHHLRAGESDFERVDDSFEDAWGNFSYVATPGRATASKTGISILMGQYLISGIVTGKTPRYSNHRETEKPPEFIYEVDPVIGRNKTHSCDPKLLGSYFDADGSRLHYLTPIYFRRAVLQPYVAEPHRYRVSGSRLECLNLWAVDISFNSAGLVEVYLGDIGEKIPDSEWGHWKTYNVPPEGIMDEGRYRRDFLGQWASSRDVPGDLRRARELAALGSAKALSAPIWRPLDGTLKAQFDSLIGPLTDSPTDLNSALLVLTKALIDSIDPSPLRGWANGEKDVKSLALLKRYLESLGDENDTSKILRLLQNYRSRGGVAHLENSSSIKAAADLGIDKLSGLEAFDSVAERATHALIEITHLINGTSGGEE